jgi:hypothetical protein
MSIVVPSDFIAVSSTETPVTFVGIGWSICKYSMYALMLSSDTAGVPGCAVDWSVMFFYQ